MHYWSHLANILRQDDTNNEFLLIIEKYKRDKSLMTGNSKINNINLIILGLKA